MNTEMLNYLAIAYAVIMLLYVLTVGFLKTRRAGAIFQIMLGLCYLGGGIFLLFQENWRKLSYIVLALAALLIILGLIFFQVWKKKPAPPVPPAPEPGPAPEPAPEDHENRKKK